MKCPNCNSSVPNSWNICRCGYNLKAADTVTKPIYKRNAEVVKSKQEIQHDIKEINNTIKNKPKPHIRKPTNVITEVIDTENLIGKQKEEMLKASEAIRRRNIDGDATKIMDISETPIGLTEPGYSKESEQAPDSNQSAQADMEAGKIGEEGITSENGDSKRVLFYGNGTTLLGIYIVNILLSIITLGVYIFWATIRALRYLYSQSELEGDRFEFHGTGLELLFGFLKAIGIIALIFGSIVLMMYFLPGIIVKIIGGFVIILLILLLIPLAILLTIKYRFSRTSWRGVRFSFRGKTKEFLKIYVKGFLFTLFTFGFYYYQFHYRTREYLINNLYFGDTKFEFDGDSKDLYKKYTFLFLITALVNVTFQLYERNLPNISIAGGLENIGYLIFVVGFIVLGIYWLKFFALRHNHYWNHTKFVTARFNLNMNERDFVKLHVINYILLIFTLGIAYPFVEIRNIRFLLERLKLQGELDLVSIQQDARTPSALGEEVASFFDIDLVGMELGI